MKSLMHIGKLPVPAGVVGYELKNRNRIRWSISNFCQTAMTGDRELEAKIRAPMLALIGQRDHPEFTGSLLTYQKVEPHTDDWNDVWYNRRWCKPAFLHHVIKGKCEVRSGKTRMKFTKGDVFALRPSIEHEVLSDTICVTYCLDIVMSQLRKQTEVLK